MFSHLAFSLPFWLVGTALVAGSVAVYFLNERRLSARTLVVPFLKFCETMPVGSGRKRPRWPLLFALQLGAIGLLIAAASGLHNASGSGSGGLAIVMDTSLSMQAKAGGATRFDQARREALQEMDRAGANDLVALIDAGPRARLVSNNRAGGHPRRDLQNLAVTDGTANLEAALDLARHALRAQSGRIHLFTDRGRALYEAWDRRIQGDHPPVIIHRCGETADNLAITGFSVYQSPLAAGYPELRAYLTVRNYSAQPVRSPYTVTLDDRPIATGACDLGPQEQRTLTIQGFEKPGVLRAWLKYDDVLPADNEAFGLIFPIRPMRILVVGESSDLKGQLERACAVPARAAGPFEMRFESSTPAGVQAMDRKTLERTYDLLIFDGRRPGLESLQPAAALWNGAATGAPAAAEADYMITSWNAQHELMEYLENFNLLRLRAGARVPAEPWLETIVEGRLGGDALASPRGLPVVAAGVNGGRRAVYFGFDLKAYRLTKYQHLKILTLNALRWLHPLARRPAHVAVGDVYNLDAWGRGAAFSVQKPNGEVVRPAPDAAGPSGMLMDRQGLYRIRLDSGEEFPVVAQVAAVWNESDLTVDPDRLWQSPPSSQSPRRERGSSDYSYSHRAWLLALMVLLIEAGLFLVYGRK